MRDLLLHKGTVIAHEHNSIHKKNTDSSGVVFTLIL